MTHDHDNHQDQDQDQDQERNKSIVRDMLAAFDRDDPAALGRHRGLHETVQHAGAMAAAFPDLRTTVESQVAEGNQVATRATVRGTHRGPFMGVSPTGKAVEFSLLAMNRLEAGEIVLHHANVDLMAILGPLGLLRLPANGPAD